MEFLHVLKTVFQSVTDPKTESCEYAESLKNSEIYMISYRIKTAATRMHSSRMRTACSCSRRLGRACLRACWDAQPPGCGPGDPPRCGPGWRPSRLPGCGPGGPPPRPDPSTSPLDVGLKTSPPHARHAGIPPPQPPPP